jgi:lysophospholipase L1-like esterase
MRRSAPAFSRSSSKPHREPRRETSEAIGAAVHAARRGGARNAEHWNLQADPRFRDAAFEDQDHLNAAGAAALAPLLEDLVAARAPTPAGRFARQNGS